MTQLDIFSIPVPRPEEARRLSGQCAAILQRLHQGPATNRELAGLSLKYTSRLSDLRAAGYDVRVVERDYASGRTVYRLEAT
jgi:uncharacterized protein YmfQ (DUF2313 family)